MEDREPARAMLWNPWLRVLARSATDAMSLAVRMIGAGLAGSEAAWQCARRGVAVELCEMRQCVRLRRIRLRTSRNWFARTR